MNFPARHHGSNVDELSLDTFTLFDLFKNKLRNVFTRAAFPHCAENYRDEKWSIIHDPIFQLTPSHGHRDLELIILC